ncbi:MAG: sulfotransferase, partial [Xanthomonadales bacterium]|nr:sulfotransferase [Xanthomonadales bacterium]NIO13137.1 sulfotransferase [Xanthomonadales bacterium]NIP11369.1 sulfotransferase [Xanthomonadales bacterium]
MIFAAQRRAGLKGFGEEEFRAPLEVLVASVNEEARLNALGRTIIHKRIVDALVTRLRARALFDQHPEIDAIDPGRVLVIAGLQRTGTTLLHRLLGADRRIRAVLSWEALNPVPLDGARERERRIRQARRAEQGLRYIAPEFFAIHPVEHDMPEEDVLLLDVSFMSQSAEATMRVPSYARWLEEHDHLPAYRYLRQLLKVLLWQHGAPALLLKSPHHLEHLDA